MTTLLILAVLVLGLLVVFRLSRVAELTSTLRGEREEVISERDNRTSGRMMWLFGVAYLSFFIWLPIHYHDTFLPVAASTQGEWIDGMFFANWIILGFVFFLTNIMLFYFVGRYYHRDGKKAFWYPHNNKLEMAWTIIPSITLVGFIIYGLTIWNKITAAPEPGTPEIELYAKQFDWTVRYPGKDGKLGATDFRLINGDNPLGVVTAKAITSRLTELRKELSEVEDQRSANADLLPSDRLSDVDDRIAHLRRMITRILNLESVMKEDISINGANSIYLHGVDDKVTKEFHLPVNKDVEILIRSQDVIHSAYLPHMRAQMNAVPGMTTRMHLVPTITTDSMRSITGNPNFDYILLCNKVCGISHYNMQMPLTIESPGAYKIWSILLPSFEKADDVPVAPADTTKAEIATPVAVADTIS